MRKCLIVLMAALLGAAWYVALFSWFGNEKRYADCLKEAKRLEEKELYLGAIEKYEEAKGLKPVSRELALRIAHDYHALGDEKTYADELKAMVADYGPDEEILALLRTYYQESGTQADRIRFLKKLQEQYPDDKTVERYYDAVKGMYREKYMSVENIGTYHGKYAVFCQAGKKD